MVDGSRVRRQVHRDQRAEGPPGGRQRGRHYAQAASLPTPGSTLRRLRDEEEHVPCSRNVCRQCDPLLVYRCLTLTTTVPHCDQDS